MVRILSSLPLLLLPIVSIGCATLVGGASFQKIHMYTVPNKALVTIYDNHTGKKVFQDETPIEVELGKSSGYFKGRQYRAVFSKDGYSDRTVMIRPMANGWYVAGNLIIGGAIGWLVVDPATGAMWRLSPDLIEIDLNVEEPQSYHADKNLMRLTLLDDVPNNLHELMQRLNP